MYAAFCSLAKSRPVLPALAAITVYSARGLLYTLGGGLAIDIIETEPDNVYEIEDADKPGVLVITPLSDGDTEHDQIDHLLYIRSVIMGKHVYIKIGLKDGKTPKFLSDTNDQGTFQL